ncbi:MAG TPA: lysophospholipid acyltransferase family protein [Clostridia bacterium]|nr:lysophospholipid acyltransferase family protein [Clostridia bacterium]
MSKTKMKSSGTPFYRFARCLLSIFSFLFYPCKLINPEQANLKKPFILICNHQSMMDPVLLGVKFPQYEIHFIGKREITKFLPLKWIVERLHMIAVSRHMSDLAAMRAAGAVLKSGEVLGIFPEGRRSCGSPMEQMESGVSLLALRHKTPLLPVYITSRPRPFRRVSMVIAPPILVDSLARDGIDKSASDQLSEQIKQVYRDLESKNIKKTSCA